MAAALRRLWAPIAWIGLMVVLGCSESGGTAEPDAGGAGSGPGAPDSGQGGRLADAAAGSGNDAAVAVGTGECNARVQEHMHTSAAAMHVAQPLAASAYNSRPPSSGPHCGTWGRYATYGADAPLPACNFLHNLEHGAIALLYDCPDGCDDVVAGLETAADALGPDPDCAAQGIKRIVLTPYSEMESKVAAAAWGFTFTADCLDADALRTLSDFMQAHWGTRGDAPEPSVCAQGSAL